MLLNNALTPTAELLEPVVLLYNAFDPTAELLIPVVLLNNAFDPTAELLEPVVLYLPEFKPRKVLLPAELALTSNLAVPVESKSVINAVEIAVIALIDTTIVPTKVAVGVITRLPVVVVVGPNVPVAVIPALL